MGHGSTRLAFAAVAAVAAAADLSAHRRDEQLQAARIAIDPDRVAVDLDITPGIDVAAAAIAAIDRDRDGVLSAPERDAYAGTVAAALWLANDHEAHALHVVSATFPDLAAIRRGEGTIALRLRAALGPHNEGRHELTFGNRHDAATSVYLANALVPRDGRVTIAGQRRTASQHELTIQYTVAPAAAPWAAGPSLAALASAAVMLVVWPLALRRRRGGVGIPSRG